MLIVHLEEESIRVRAQDRQYRNKLERNRSAARDGISPFTCIHVNTLYTDFKTKYGREDHDLFYSCPYSCAIL